MDTPWHLSSQGWGQISLAASQWSVPWMVGSRFPVLLWSRALSLFSEGQLQSDPEFFFESPT